MNGFRKVLCHVDVEGDDYAALKSADWTARAHDALLTVVDVQREPSWRDRLVAGFEEEVATRLIEDRTIVLRDKVADLCAISTQADVNVLRGSSWVEIIREVLRHGYDLVVTACGGDGGRFSLLGSTAAHLVRKCPCPVWLLKPGAQPRSRKVLAAISPNLECDASIEFNRKIVEIARLVSRQQDAALLLLHVWDVGGYSVPYLGMSKGPLGQHTKGVEKAVKKKLVGFLEIAGLQRLEDKLRFVRETPVSAISDFAEDHGVDLIVWGLIEPSGVKGLLVGHEPRALLNKAPCSLLTVKPDGFVTPVALENGAARIAVQGEMD